VVQAAAVIRRVLDELEAGNADGLHVDVVGAARVTQGDGVGPEAVEGLEPFLEHGGGGHVALGVDAANAARAVVDVEVGHQFRITGAGLNGPAGAPGAAGVQGVQLRVAERSAGGQMAIDVGQGAVQPLLLAVQQGESDAAPGPYVHRLQDPRGLHDHGGASGVVHGAVRGGPAVEVGPGHDVFARAAGSRDVGQDVVGVDVLVVETDL